MDKQPAKIRILYTISELVYSSQVRNLCDLISLVDRDIFDIEIASLSLGDPATKEIARLNVPYYQLRLQPSRNIRSSKNIEFLKGPFQVPGKNFDIVHSLLYQSFFTEPFFIKLLSKSKYIYTKSNLEWRNHSFNWKLKSLLSDKIVSISNATDAVLANNGFKDKIEKIYLGIDTDYFVFSEKSRFQFRGELDIPKDSFVFACVAQFINLKDHITVIESFNDLSKYYDDIYLLLAGPDHNDKYYHAVLKRINNSPARNRIKLLGVVEKMPMLYSAIDCLVMTSEYESFGYVYVEAMSCNRPSIARINAGGPSEIIIDGETGYFVKPADPKDLAAKMELYLKDQSLAETQGIASRQRAVNLFSKKTMAKQCQNLYLKVLNKPSTINFHN